MKLICEISVYNRLAPHIKPRSQQSTLALGYHPPGATKNLDSLFLIHFTAINKVGTRYKVKRNIEKVFTKFVQDGKTTVSIKQPPHDLQIRCDPIQLKAFLQIFKMAVDGKLDPSKLGLSTLAVTAVPKSAVPLKTMTIQTPSDYPLRGLPKTLTTLNVNGIRKYSLDAQILSLNNLQILNMSNNCIEHLPKRLGDLRLVQLDLSSNKLDNSNVNDWDWLDRPSIKSTLQNLNLADNSLAFFPYRLVRLRRLMVLVLKGNRLKTIPFAIRRLKRLTQLNLADNQMNSLPNIISRMALQTLDLSGCEMFTAPAPTVPPPPAPHFLGLVQQPFPLWQISANFVVKKKIKYGPNDLPTTVIDSLEEYPFCDCGQLCPPSEVFHHANPLKLQSVSCVTTSAIRPIYGDSIYCSAYCQFKYSYQNYFREQ